ncbi:hypothetical protein ACFPM3_06850 [Streptomyces coeruleoprunus]|uniref:Integral membrane protein n=1 Tax=Streptomyces coeruleoprunus TaxID=285563 RepID=A0ABV9XC58_9ACTN
MGAMGEERGARAARARALAVLRVRGRALAVALLPAAVAVVLLAGGTSGHLTGTGWDVARRVAVVVALVVLAAAAVVGVVIARARPVFTPTVEIAEASAPDLYRMVRDLAARLAVPEPSAIALTPDCDSWLEERTHRPAPRTAAGDDAGIRSGGIPADGSRPDTRGPAAVPGTPTAYGLPAGSRPGPQDEPAAHGPTASVTGDAGASFGTGRTGGTGPAGSTGRTGGAGLPARSARPGGSRRQAAGGPGPRRSEAAPVLVIGSPFLWWMRVGELRAVLAPVVAGTGPAAHPDIAAARRFVRGLDAAVTLVEQPGLGAVRRLGARGVAAVARVLLRASRGHAAEMERGVAAAASERAQAVDYGLRIVAQEQVGLAYAGWDRLLTRVALPAWRMGRWPSRLDAGVVSALTELSRRDRLAEGFASRLGERPACDLLEEPGLVDEATSLLAARLFHGGPAESGPDWAPVDWQQYPEEVVDRKWRSEAARLHRALDRLGVRRGAEAADADVPEGPTLARVMDHLATSRGGETLAAAISAEVAREEAAAHRRAAAAPRPDSAEGAAPPRPDVAEGAAAPRSDAAEGAAADMSPAPEAPPEAPAPATAPDAHHPVPGTTAAGHSPADLSALHVWGGGDLPLFPLQPPRTGRELLADHVTAMVCCAAVDTAGAAPGLDWLDGPTLLVDDEGTGRKGRADVASGVLALIEDADPEPLRAWLAAAGVRPEKPVRLV